MAVRGTNSLFFESGIDTTGLKAGAAEATGIVQGLASTIGKISPFGILASAAATAFAKIGNDAYKMMKEFEQAMKEVQTISKATQDDFEGISNAVFALSKVSPDAPAKLAKAYYQIVSAGYDGAEGLELLETATKAATAGVTTTEKAADGLTTVLNAFKLEAEDAERVSDILFTTVRLGKTTIDELSNSLSEVAPLAASSGYNFEEIAAAVASLTKQGTPTSQAMTQIRAAIEAANEVLGDGAAKSMTLQNALQAIYKEAGGSQNKLKELTGRVEAMSAILAVSGKNARGAQQDLAEYAKAAGATNLANERMLISNTNQWGILGNRIKATTKELGDALVDISSVFAGFVNEALDSNEQIISSYEKQRIEVYKLKNSLEGVNEESEEFNSIRDEIIKNYPEFIGNIDKEKTTTDQLLSVLNQVNDAYILRFKFATRQKELEEALRKQGETEMKIENAQEQFDKTLASLQVIAEDKGIELKINPDLNNQELIKSLRDQLREAGKGLTVASGFGNVNPKEGFAESSLREMGAVTSEQNRLNQLLIEQKNLVEDLTDRNRKLSKAELQTASGRAEAIKRINAATKSSQLSDFQNSGIDEIEKALKAREKVIAQFRQIDDVQKLESLKPFLESENKEIVKYAEAKSRYLNTGFSGAGGGDGESDYLKELQKQLKETEQNYQNYFNLVRRGYDDLANGIYANLLKQGADYEDYLDRRIQAAQSAAEKEALILAKDNEQRTILSAGSFGITENQANKKPSIKLDVKDLEKLLKQSGLKASSELATKEGNNSITVEPGRKEEEQNKKLIDALYQVTDGLYGVADLYYSMSGDEEGANRLAQFAGVAEGAGMIASGNIVGGAMKVLTSAITTEIESNTAVYEEAIGRLEKSIEQLDYAISQSVGTERVNSRQDAIRDLEDMEIQAKKAEEAEKEAEKQVKVLGLTIAKKGKGSGTDQAKIEEFQEKAKEARREVEALNKELDELFTGTTASNITDSIIQGFRDGYTAVEDFAESFEDLMKNALLNAFQIKFIEDEVGKFYEKFSEYGSDQQFSAREIESLREMYGSMIEGAQADMNAINDILESTGIGSLYDQPANREGMSGAIKGITEDQAGVLEGYWNAVRIDTREMLIVAQQSSLHIAEIASNTRYNRYLESINNKMSTIENGILEFQSRN